MTRNDEILMNFDEFIDIHSKPGVQRSLTRKTPDFDRNLLQVLIQLPVRKQRAIDHETHTNKHTQTRPTNQ